MIWPLAVLKFRPEGRAGEIPQVTTVPPLFVGVTVVIGTPRKNV